MKKRTLPELIVTLLLVFSIAACSDQGRLVAIDVECDETVLHPGESTKCGASGIYADDSSDITSSDSSYDDSSSDDSDAGTLIVVVVVVVIVVAAVSLVEWISEPDDLTDECTWHASGGYFTSGGIFTAYTAPSHASGDVSIYCAAEGRAGSTTIRIEP